MRKIFKNINQTVLAKPDFYLHRRIIFKIVGVIWGNKINKEIYDLYSIIHENLNVKEENKMHQLQRLFIDLSGLLSGISEDDNCKTILELAIKDFKGKIRKMFTSDKYLDSFFELDNGKEIYIELLIEITNKIINNSKFNWVCLEVEEIFIYSFNYFIKMISINEEKILKDKTIKIFKNFIKLNPLK